jgi:serine phosphatase RsbU (regulator of sigma subunit)/anti-sigma regulatory factor (Ser/Thr protein kinase)
MNVPADDSRDTQSRASRSLRPEWRIGTKLILLTVPLIAVISLLTAFVVYERNKANLQQKLSQRAKSLHTQIMADRGYYAKVIVPRLIEMGGTIGVDYKDVHGRFPLPATFVREVSEVTAANKNGYQASLISPWAINRDKSLKDQFQKDAFQYLVQNPTGQFVRIDTIEGRTVMRVLMADIASAKSCVDCHNGHAQSPKRDFKLNDLMGGLEIDMPIDQYVKESRQELALTLAGGAGISVLILFIVAFSTKRTVSEPLASLAGKMEDFVGQRPYAPGQVTARLVGDEVIHITSAFEQMKGVIGSQQQELREANQLLEQRVIDRTTELRRTMEEKERIGSELRIASEIQRSILPRIFPPFPDRDEFELYAETIPAREMGGDFYDFFLIDEDRLGLVIADVSGKGVPAAIFMAVSRTMLKATAMQAVSPAECLLQVNNLLCPDNDSAMFVTVFYAILNTRTGDLEYSNAGHNLPYLLSAQGSVAMLDNPGGMALGVVQDNPYLMRQIRLRPGEGLFLYTDGVTEAMDTHGALFSDARLRQLLQRVRSGTPDEIIRETVAEVRRYAAGEPQADDITLLALRYLEVRPGTKKSKPATVTVRLRNDLSELEHLSQTVASFGEKHQWAGNMIASINLALDELITNIISYGFDDQGTHEIVLRLSFQEGELTAEVEDEGRAFNPLGAPEPDLTKPIEERQIGGLGIHLARKIMDRLEYRRERGKNILVMKKRISA